VIALAAGFTHVVAARRDGTVWAWGNNSLGQLGDGTTVARSRPV
jgi:alpha-tubulin suppressor-like RCC1 family protein